MLREAGDEGPTKGQPLQPRNIDGVGHCAMSLAMRRRPSATVVLLCVHPVSTSGQHVWLLVPLRQLGHPPPLRTHRFPGFDATPSYGNMRPPSSALLPTALRSVAWQ